MNRMQVFGGIETGKDGKRGRQGGSKGGNEPLFHLIVCC